MTTELDARAPFYVYNNIHAWVNGVNLGNGLADLLCHFVVEPGGIAPHPKTFVEYANKYLTTETSLEEVANLLKYHHPAYISNLELKDYLFKIKENGEVDPEDVNLLRIIEIRNAYLIEYNNLNKGETFPDLTIEEAVVNIVPQTATLTDSYGINFNVAEFLNTIVMLENDRREYITSLFTNSLMTAVVDLMAYVNNLNNKANGRTYISTELLDKYFNGGSVDYPEGKDFRFYLDGKAQFEYPELTRLNLNDPFSDVNIQKVTEIIRRDYPYTNKRKLDRLAKKYIIMYMRKPGTGRRYTALESLNILAELGELAPYERSGNRSPYIPGIGLQLSDFGYLLHFYEIPEIKLNEQYKELLDKKYFRNEIIRDRLSIITKYFKDLTKVVFGYKWDLEQKAKLAIKKSAKSTSARRTIVRR